MPVTAADRAPRWAPAGWTVLAVVTASVAAVLAGGLAAVTLPVLLGATLTRSAADVAGVACVGLALAATLLPLGHDGRPPRELATVLRRGDRGLVVFAVTWLGVALLGVAFRAAEAYGRPLTALRADELGTFATGLAAGRGLLLAAGCAAVVTGCAVARLREPARVPVRLVLVTALLGLLAPVVTGHSGASDEHELAVVTVALHVAAAALWVGGLGALLVLAAPRPQLIGAVLPRYSALAGACLAAVVVSGVLNAALRLPTWAALVTTGYGALVVAKVVCAGLLGGLGGLARRRLRAGRLPVLRWAGVEVALMAVTLGLAAALTQSG